MTDFAANDFIPYLDSLHSITAALAPGLPFRPSLEKVLAILAEHLHFDHPHFVVQDPASGNLHLSLAHGAVALPHLSYAPGTGITGQVFSTATPIVVERMKDHPDFMNRLFERSEEELLARAFLCVPVFADNWVGEGRAVIGTLSADTPVAPVAELAARSRFLEVVAQLVGRQVAYLQEEMIRARQHTTTKDATPLPRQTSIVSLSKAMNHVLHHAAQVAPARTTALLRGESGTGKELLAEAIHQFSPRKDNAYIKVNCAALPAELVESELFGWVKGAFTGANHAHKGRFELAHRGSLFLDEVGDLPLPAQAKLLRAIQEGEVVPLGGEKPIQVDVRLICATHQPLEQLVEKKLFREDLYYRINVFPIVIPPLRARREDILPLAAHFLESFARENGRQPQGLSAQACDLLTQYTWPGNVRELRNVMERACLVSEGEQVRAIHLPESLQTQTAQTYTPKAGLNLKEEVERLERYKLDEALKRSHGNIHQAARLLGISYRICQYKLQKYGMEYKEYQA